MQPARRVLIAAVALVLVVGLSSRISPLAAQASGAAAPTSKPLGRASAGVAYDIARDELVVFGGFASFGDPPRNAYLRDTWTWSGGVWTRKHPASSPPAGYGFAMAYDEARHVVVLFGGGNDHTTSGQTWIWDGTNWGQQFPASSPPQSFGSTADYDDALGRVVLLTGDSFNPGTTWSWDGSNWHEEPATGPTARVFMGGAYDSANGTYLVFGGSWSCGDLPCPLGDTWTWDGTEWTPATPADSPTDRVAPAAAFDPAGGVVVLFGGVDLSPGYRDTWTWDGTDWTRLSPARAPAARSQAGMVFDDALGTVLLFGGGTFVRDQHYSFGDLWSWDGVNWTRLG